MDEEAEELREAAEKALLEAIVTAVEDGQASSALSLAQAYEIVAGHRSSPKGQSSKQDRNGVLKGTR